MAISSHYEISDKRHWLLRTIALIVDFALVNSVAAILYFAVGQPLVSVFLYTALAGLVYGVCIETFAKGVTLGLLITNLRVVSLLRTRPFMRKIYRLVGVLMDLLPFIQLITIPSNVALAFFNPRRMLCDWMGKTAVVYRHSVLMEVEEK